MKTWPMGVVLALEGAEPELKDVHLKLGLPFGDGFKACAESKAEPVRYLTVLQIGTNLQNGTTVNQLIAQWLKENQVFLNSIPKVFKTIKVNTFISDQEPHVGFFFTRDVLAMANSIPELCLSTMTYRLMRKPAEGGKEQPQENK